MGYTNTMRLVGLNSGLDTESLVTQLMNAESMKLNSYKRKATTLTWKQETYRSVYSDLKSFQSSYLDLLSSSSMRSAGTFKKFTATVKNAAGADSTAVKASTSSSAGAGTYKVKVQQLAQTDVWESESKIGGIKGTEEFDVSNIKRGDSFKFTLDGVSRPVSFELWDEVTFKVVTGKDDQGRDIQEDVTGQMLFHPQTKEFTGFAFQYSGSREKMEVTKDGDGNFTGFKFSDSDGGSPTTVTMNNNDIFVKALNAKLQSAYGTETVDKGSNSERTSAKIFASLDGGKLTINTSPLSSHTASIQEMSMSEGRLKDALGLGNGQSSASTAIDTGKTLVELFGENGLAGDNWGEFAIGIGGNYGYFSTIDENGQSKTLNDLINEVNSSDLGVTLSYSASAQTFKLESNETGVANKITVSGGFAQNNLGLTKNEQKAQDSIATINGETFIRETNDYKELDVNWSFTEATGTDTLTVTIGKDTDSIYNNIKNFVDAYNSIIDVLNGITNTRRPKSNGSYFDPLLDEEKESMKDSEIANWEEKAKTGLLYRDSLISNIASQMRNTVYQPVQMEDGSSLGLYQIGITTGDWKNMGKLVIDEEKLRAAIEENGDNVAALFTGTESGAKGIGDKLNAIVEEAVNSYGTIAKKAGIEGSYTEANNELYRMLKAQNEKINSLMAKLQRKETYYYNMFAKLESAMSQSDSQMSYITSVFSQG